MKEAVIVSVARTAIGRAYRGAFNDTEAPVLGGHVVSAVVERAGIDPAEVDDLQLGIAAQQGTQGYNLGRLCVYTGRFAGDACAGMAIDRMCSSGLVAIARWPRASWPGSSMSAIAGGLESISLTQNQHKNSFRAQSKAVLEAMPTAYIQMIETAELVSQRYGIGRARQDEYALQSQQRTAAAQGAGRFDEEIVPITVQQAALRQGRQAVGPADRDLVERRRQPRGHHLGKPCRAEAGMEERPVGQGGRVHHRGQCVATVRRCRGCTADECRRGQGAAD